VRKQKTDKRDAAHILKLVRQGRFPRLWSPDREQRDLRQLVLHRHKLTQPGVGPNTALAYVLTISDVSRFRRGKQVASYLGLIPREESSGGKQKLGAITKQGNRRLRSLLVEAAQTAVQHDSELRKQYLHRCHQKPKGVAKVATARKLVVRLYWMLRTQTKYPEIVRIESSPRVPLVGAS
jgi:transposase